MSSTDQAVAFIAMLAALDTTGTDTQHIDEIFPEIGRVILLRAGTIADDGPKERVIRGRHLEDVFGAPLTVEESGGYFHVRPADV